MYNEGPANLPFCIPSLTSPVAYVPRRGKVTQSVDSSILSAGIKVTRRAVTLAAPVTEHRTLTGPPSLKPRHHMAFVHA